MELFELKAVIRRLMRRPGTSLLSIVALGVGLGVLLFVLDLVNGLILQPLPFPHADRLVAYGYEDDGEVDDWHYADYLQVTSRLKSVDESGAYTETSVNVSDGGARAHHYIATEFAGSALSLLGVQPILGRGFAEADYHPGSPMAVMISERVWRNDFDSSNDIVGRSVRVNGELATVTGVMPDGFAFPNYSDVWFPARFASDSTESVNVIARLAPGASLHQAHAELDTLNTSLKASLWSLQNGRELTIQPLAQSFVAPKTRAYVWLMLAAGGLVMLLACANVANLQLGQSLYRQRELAVRSALGASGPRIVADQLLESLVLSLLAAIVALILQQGGIHWLTQMYAASGKGAPYFVDLKSNLRTLLFALIGAAGTALLIGLVPAWRAVHTDIQDSLRDGAKGSRGGAFATFSKVLVVFEISLTVILLVGAGVFVNGLQRMLDAGTAGTTDPTRILVSNIQLSGEQYNSPEARRNFVQSLEQRLQADPGVSHATVGNTVPGAKLGSHEYIAALGQTDDEIVRTGKVDDQFMNTFGLKLSAGRFFNSSDTADGRLVVVIDRMLAKTLWPGTPDPLGRKIVLWPHSPGPLTLTVIGVADSLQLDGPLEKMMPSMLLSIRQFAPSLLTVAVQPHGEPMAWSASLQTLLAGLDPQLASYGTQTQAQAIAQSRTSAVVLTEVFSFIGLVALLLAAAGLYGVLAYSVAQRTPEFGIRRAIGAGTVDIAECVGRQLLWQLAVGLGLGTLLAVPWAKVLSDPTLHTQGMQVPVFATVLMTVIVVAVAAAVGPVWRAVRVDPMVALRYE